MPQCLLGLSHQESENLMLRQIFPSPQCADDPDAVCTRSASVRIRDMDNSIIKMKRGGGVSLNGQDIQIPSLQGVFTWADSGQPLKASCLVVVLDMPQPSLIKECFQCQTLLQSLLEALSFQLLSMQQTFLDLAPLKLEELAGLHL